MPAYSSLLERTLPTPIPVTDRAPIGRPMKGLIPADARLVEKTVVGERVFERYERDGFDAIERHYPAVAIEPGWMSNEVIRLTQGGTTKAFLTRIEGGKTPTGRVEYFTTQTPHGSLTLSDDDGDGRVDWVSEPVGDLQGFRPEGFDPAWRTDRVYNRVLEDTDKDGRFDVEKVTGEWWRDDAPPAAPEAERTARGRPTTAE